MYVLSVIKNEKLIYFDSESVILPLSGECTSEYINIRYNYWLNPNLGFIFLCNSPAAVFSVTPLPLTWQCTGILLGTSNTIVTWNNPTKNHSKIQFHSQSYPIKFLFSQVFPVEFIATKHFCHKLQTYCFLRNLVGQLVRTRQLVTCLSMKNVDKHLDSFQHSPVIDRRLPV